MLLRILPAVRTTYALDLHVVPWFSDCFDNRLRQYPLYNKKTPPPALAEHFTPEVFQKSQEYGKDKAKFALITGLYKQALDSAFLQYGLYAWAWSTAGNLIARFGYGAEYEVRMNTGCLTLTFSHRNPR